MTEEQKQQIMADRLSAYRNFLTSDEGSQILCDLMESCFFTTSTIGQTPEITYYNEGQRSVVLRIIDTAKLTPDEIDRFVGRAKKRQEEINSVMLTEDIGGTGYEI
jgi:hypothetical protein